MTNQQQPKSNADFDAIVIGAGFSGMYMLHSLRDKLGFNVTLFEATTGQPAMLGEAITDGSGRFSIRYPRSTSHSIFFGGLSA